jgi:hypothetical protein
MKKFVFVYQGKGMAQDISKEEMKASMDRWMAWFSTFQDKMVDGGNPFAPEGKSVTAKGVEIVSHPATGYTIINAKDMDEAVSIVKTCPALEESNGGGVQVYEAMPM